MPAATPVVDALPLLPNGKVVFPFDSFELDLGSALKNIYRSPVKFFVFGYPPSTHLQ